MGKIRITGGDFSMVDEVSIPGLEDNTMSPEEIRDIVEQMKSSNGDEEKYLPPFSEFLNRSDQRSETVSNCVYTLMDKDGYLAIAMPGIIAVMNRDLENLQYIYLEGEAVDNGISVDDQGGIYCVTSKYMRKVHQTLG